MDVVIGRFTVRPGQTEAWDAAFASRVEDGRHHPGWLGVTVGIPRGADLERVVVGRWRAQDDYIAWMATPAFQASVVEMEPMQSGPPDVTWHFVSLAADPDRP